VAGVAGVAGLVPGPAADPELEAEQPPSPTATAATSRKPDHRPTTPRADKSVMHQATQNLLPRAVNHHSMYLNMM
jgi:hypothetical protein